jgi:hypothetical protein
LEPVQVPELKQYQVKANVIGGHPLIVWQLFKKAIQMFDVIHPECLNGSSSFQRSFRIFPKMLPLEIINTTPVPKLGGFFS